MTKEIKLITPEEYVTFGKEQPTWTFLCTPQAGDKMLDRALDKELVGYFEDGKLQAAAMLVYYRTAKVMQYVYLPRGPLMDFEDKRLVRDFFRNLQNYLKSKNVLYLIVNPYLKRVERDAQGERIEGEDHLDLIAQLKETGFLEKIYDPAFEIEWMSVLPIEGESMDSLLKKMDQQTRWSINRALKYELTLENSHDPKDMIEFARMMEHTGERRGFDGYDSSFYESMLEHYGDDLDCFLCYLEPDKLIASQSAMYEQAKKEYDQALENLERFPNSKKMIKKQKVAQEAMDLAQKKIDEAKELKKTRGDKILLAGSIFISNDREMVYLFSGAYKEFLNYNAPYMIHHAAIQKALNNRLKAYNFYGILPHFKKGEEGYSLYKFKKGFGANVVQLLGNFILPIEKKRFSLYNKLRPIAQEIDLDNLV